MTSKQSSDSDWPKIAKTAATLQRKGERVSVTPGNTPVIESAGAIVARSQGPMAQVNQTNNLSTPVLLVMLAAMILSIAIASVAIGISNQAEREAQNAEREARVAMNHADLLDVDTKANKALIDSINVKLAVREEVREK